MFKNFLSNSSPKAKVLVFGGSFLILLVFIISLIFIFKSSFTTEEQHIHINNLEDISLNISDDYKKQIQSLIWNTIKDQDHIDSSSLIDSNIRENSITIENNHVTLLVDIESLHYTFRVSFYQKPNNENNTISYQEPSFYIECPYPEEVVYSDTKCPVGTPVDQINRYLPFSLTLNTEKGTSSVSVNLKKYTFLEKYAKENYLEISINACGDKTILKSGESTVKKWLKEHYFDPNDFHIEIVNLCRDATPEGVN